MATALNNLINQSELTQSTGKYIQQRHNGVLHLRSFSRCITRVQLPVGFWSTVRLLFFNPPGDSRIFIKKEKQCDSGNQMVDSRTFSILSHLFCRPVSPLNWICSYLSNIKPPSLCLLVILNSFHPLCCQRYVKTYFIYQSVFLPLYQRRNWRQLSAFLLSFLITQTFWSTLPPGSINLRFERFVQFCLLT